MDPVTLVAAAVAAGAAAGLTDTAKQAVVDAYQAVKGLITRRYESVDVAVVEMRPEVPSRRLVLAEELTQAGAGGDEELLAAARYLLQVIQEQAPRAAETVGVKLTRVEAGEIEITDIASSGSGFIATDTSVAGTLKVSGIQAGIQEPPHPPIARR
ncbi:hypothetical protein [Nocardia abscessus]|uniref:hypothetical protein n=1 Tax=Nocardia abscessus TaxID=120957 RepID=UPI0024585620|nr:hypothetical protein [Nocardia abscessus]